MFDDFLEILKEYENQDELIDTMARVMKKWFDALVRAGFTEEQAANIVASQGTGMQGT